MCASDCSAACRSRLPLSLLLLLLLPVCGFVQFSETA
jgi:hypothetical protein